MTNNIYYFKPPHLLVSIRILQKLNIAQWPCTKRHPLFPDPFSSFLGSKIDKKERKETPNIAPYNYQYVIVRVSFSSAK